ncbi:MAG: hypothetical protein AMJ53_00735 [Gammaproteobacteria bacterium SG8_11]|nr:MAG: hypothetical protein AMJ53_00735 [Gammaproteobacteria bacterium SG8_11]
MRKYNWKLRLGLSLILLAAPIFMSLLLIPFLDIENKVKISLTTAIIITGEIVFWSGGLLVGKEMFSKYKSYMNPKNWFKKRLENKE